MEEVKFQCFVVDNTFWNHKQLPCTSSYRVFFNFKLYSIRYNAENGTMHAYIRDDLGRSGSVRGVGQDVQWSSSYNWRGVASVVLLPALLVGSGAW